MRIIGLRAGMLAAVLACGSAGQAAAETPAAPAAAPNVVVIAISVVTQPEGPSGTCTVKGQVRQVERGRLFGVGQNVSFEVPCRHAGAKARAGADADKVSAAPYGRAYLDAKGALVPPRYETLDEPPPPAPE